MIERLGALIEDVGPALRPEALTHGYLRQFPPAHRELMLAYNGFSAYHGAYRMFGVDRDDHLDLERWNDLQTWRFAWGSNLGPFLCFGESAWGDQYAYRFAGAGRLEPTVYFLEATVLEPEPLWPTFEDFRDQELARVVAEPYDSQLLATVERLGGISADRHWMFTPPTILGGPESLDNITTIASATAMTFAGDIVSGLLAAPEDSRPLGLETWRDDRGRARMELLLASPATSIDGRG